MPIRPSLGSMEDIIARGNRNQKREAEEEKKLRDRKKPAKPKKKPK